MRYYVMCEKENEEVVADKMAELNMEKAASIDEAEALIQIGPFDADNMDNVTKTATFAILLGLPIRRTTLDKFLALA